MISKISASSQRYSTLKASFIESGMLFKCFGKVTLIVREASLEEMLSSYGSSLKFAKYWIVLIEDSLCIIDESVLYESIILINQ